MEKEELEMEEEYQEYPIAKYLSQEQRLELPWLAVDLGNYWAEFRPKMTKELYEEGKLYEKLKKEGRRLVELMVRLSEQGMDEMEMTEILREEKYRWGMEEDEEET